MLGSSVRLNIFCFPWSPHFLLHRNSYLSNEYLSVSVFLFQTEEKVKGIPGRRKNVTKDTGMRELHLSVEELIWVKWERWQELGLEKRGGASVWRVQYGPPGV